MALLGRDHAGDPELGPLLDELSTQSGYHHRLALVAASAAGDVGRLRSALTHPARRIHSFAFANLARDAVAPQALLDRLLNGSAEDRRRLRRFVNRNGLTEVAEAVIEDVRRELGDREAGALLAACSEETVRRLLPELRYATPSLRSLARRHPGVLLDHVEEELQGLSRRQRDVLWSEIDRAVRELALADPDRTLRLVEDSGPSWVVPRGLHPVLGYLIRFAPSRVARLIASDQFVQHLGRSLPASLRRNSNRFADADRVDIARALREREKLLVAWIGSFAPSDRADVFTRVFDDLDMSNKVWATAFLDVLPHDTRHAEARRILGTRAIRDSDASTLRYTAFLPLADARDTLAAQLGRPKAEDRGLGYYLLISCARRERSPDRIAEVLGLCARLRNEQDLVRLSAVQTLATVKPSLLTSDHLGDLQALVRATVEARDTSSATLQGLSVLAFGIMGDAAEEPTSDRFRFALSVLDQVAGPTGSVAFPRLDHLLRAGAEVPLVDSLMPRLERDAALDRHQMALSLARALRKRAWRHSGLQRLLERATAAASDSVVTTAIGLWLADPRTRPERAARLLRNDESTVAIPVVLTTMVRSRQDLLDALLWTRPLSGRFLKGRVRYVPIIPDGFERWLPRQCEAYRSALDSLIATPGTAARSRAAAIHTLARLPGIGSGALAPYLAASDVAVQEAALSGLAWTDEPGWALDRLVGYAGTDRARVAVYTVTRCARFVPRSELRRPLEWMLGSEIAKITAKKEAARLLGSHRPPGAVDVLLDAIAADGVHRDVRVAIGRSLRGSLDDERVWRILTQLSSGTDDEARSLIETTPDQLPPRHRARYGELVLAAGRSRSQHVRAKAFAACGVWARWSPRAPAVACHAIEGLDAGPEWRSALGSLTVMLRDGEGWSEASDLVTTLAARADPPELDAGSERDRPSAQRLDSVLAGMADLPTFERRDHREDLLRVVDLLSPGGQLGHGELTIRLAAVDWGEPTTALAAIARRLEDRPMLAVQAMGAAALALSRDQAAWGLDTFGDTADHLIGRGSVGTGTLALQLVQSAGARFDWPEPWRNRLRALRSHATPDVAALAQRVWTAPE